MTAPNIFACRVCGLEAGDPPWGEDGDSPTFDICDCCGVEFGYGDASAVGIARWRDRWIAAGAQWTRPELRPPGWSLEDQLKRLGIGLA